MELHFNKRTWKFIYYGMVSLLFVLVVVSGWKVSREVPVMFFIPIAAMFGIYWGLATDLSYKRYFEERMEGKTTSSRVSPLESLSEQTE